MNYLKKFLGTKSLDTKQCAGGLSFGIISHYPPKSLSETLGMGKNKSQQPKILLLSPTSKNPLINLLLQ